MRICFLALGKFAHVDPYIDYFRKRGHEVHFVALAPGPSRDVPTHNVGSNGGFLSLLGKSSYLPAIVRARGVVRRLAPDIVHAHYATSAGLAAFICRVHPWIVTAHGTDVTLGVNSLLWRVLLRVICRQADCVHVVSNDLRDKVIGLGTVVDKVETFSIGIDTTLFRFRERSVSYPAAPLRLICTRRLEAVYDHATIIRGMSLLKKRGVRFVLTIIGDGIARAKLETLATELRIKDWITFAGGVPNNQLPAALSEHDIYLSASTRDGASLCLLEAMACGLYPVVSDIPANTEWIKNGRNGLLHKVEDPESLAECIGQLMNWTQDKTVALAQNRELVETRGDRLVNMSRVEELYQRLQSRAGSARNH
jgi:glycosyltransferase involved in cell wall biosynthesis